MSEDCYFFVDPDPTIKEEDRTMNILCLECHDTHMPDTGWFYQGSKEGYGPYEYQCCRCNKKINDEEEEEEEIEEETETTN